MTTRLTTRTPLFVGFATVAVLVLGFGTWGVFASIAGAVVAPGRIEVDQNRQVVQHLVGGVVRALRVEEGQQVAAGDILIELDHSEVQSSLAIATSQLNGWRARRARLEAERDGLDWILFATDMQNAAVTDPELADFMVGQRNLFAARAESLHQEIDQLTRREEQIRAQIAGLEAQGLAFADQRKLIDEELETAQSLRELGLTEASRVSGLRRERARLLGLIGENRASVAEAEGRITEIQLAILNKRSSRREDAITELREVRMQESESGERRQALAHRRAQLDIRAPVAGVVYGLRIHGTDAVVQPAEPILYIVPRGRPLIVKSRINSTNVDEVHVGQSVILRFPALDHRWTPELVAHVRNVSADAFTDQNSGASYYELEIVPDDGEAVRLGEQVLVPGMPVEAFVRSADRSPLNYLLRPLLDYFNRAFREG